MTRKNQKEKLLSMTVAAAPSVAVTIMTLGNVSARGKRMNERWTDVWEAGKARSLSVPEPMHTRL